LRNEHRISNAIVWLGFHEGNLSMIKESDDNRVMSLEQRAGPAPTPVVVCFTDIVGSTARISLTERVSEQDSAVPNRCQDSSKWVSEGRVS